MRELTKITLQTKTASQTAGQKSKVSRASEKGNISDLDICNTFLFC